ncbi:MAG TPA: hypothetical protein VGP61_11555, partial [Gemmatimonadales bacterium]|nr:hypothetical protein [Gemmatimonadales bacterium]
MRRVLLLLPLLLAPRSQAPLTGSWRGALDLAGAVLPFELRFQSDSGGLRADLCNGSRCDSRATVVLQRDSIQFDIADYEATISAVRRGDS